MKMERLEKVFLWSTAVVLALFFGGIVLSVSESGIHLPDKVDTIDPTEVSSTPPFDAPGVYERGAGEYEVVVIAKAWAFEPAEITVPADAEVTFTVTSQDVIHGFMIPETQVNAMVIPGHITRVTYTFDEAGEHNIICHEFCGIGHHGMFGKVVVEG